VKVVADSHTLVFLLSNPARLSARAAEALREAEDSDGIVVSAISLGDIWYSTQKTSSPAIPTDAYEAVRAAVASPALNIEIAPVTAATMLRFEEVPLAELRDPFDRVILATAIDLGLPLVTADRAISKTKAVKIVW
jgi:PIN domain nuclease of toxin-antitoxin system